MKKLFKSNEIYLLIILIFLSIIIGSFNKGFLSLENFFDLLKSGSVMGIMAVGFLIVLISGGIDVSFTAIASVSMYTTVTILNKFGGNIFIAFMIASLIGIILGFINALLISYFKIPTLIATLGTMNVYHASILVIGKKAHIALIPESIVNFGKKMIFTIHNSNGKEFGLSYLSLVMIIIFIITWVLLKYTTLGRNIYAIGGSFEAAQRAGISTKKVQIFIYCYMGLLSGVAGLIKVALVRYVNSFDLMGTEIDIIAAVVLGGAAIFGGIGSVIGTVLGVFLLVILKNSLILVGIPSEWDYVIIGIVIIFSILFMNYGERKKKLV